MNMELTHKFQQFNETLTEAEKANFKLVLGLSVGGMMPEFKRPDEKKTEQALDTVTSTLASLQPYSKRISQNGIAYHGRPLWMTNELLQELQNESESTRSGAQRFDEHFLGCGGPIADKLSTSNLLVEFVREHAGDVKPTGVASFLFYEEEGQGIDPHIDTDIFSLNVLVMLKHKRVADAVSALVVFPPHEQPERIELRPGEVVIMFAGSITHGRERMCYGESVSILTFGFHPLGI